VIEKAPCAFAVAPRGYSQRPDPELRVIGLAYDGSESAKHAADVAKRLAVKSSCPLRAFGVVEPLTRWVTPGLPVPPHDPNFMREVIEEALNEVMETLPPGVGGQALMLDGDPAEALLAVAPETVDLMVFGTHGFGRLMQVLTGSVASDVVRRAPWPVVVVPPSHSHPVEFSAHTDEGAQAPVPPAREAGLR
jgi:nucleotide-binding universal stress UspA family protein